MTIRWDEPIEAVYADGRTAGAKILKSDDDTYYCHVDGFTPVYNPDNPGLWYSANGECMGKLVAYGHAPDIRNITPTIDWTAPLEAVHEDGDTTPVELVSSSRGREVRPILCRESEPVVAIFREDGTHAWNDERWRSRVRWRIRNRTEQAGTFHLPKPHVPDIAKVKRFAVEHQPDTLPIDRALWERCVGLVRSVAECQTTSGPNPAWFPILSITVDESRAIAALLPVEPVDPDLVTAREIVALAMENGSGSSHEDRATRATNCRAGQWDSSPQIVYALAALKRRDGK